MSYKFIITNSNRYNEFKKNVVTNLTNYEKFRNSSTV